jgi:hypothetical protein
MFLFRDISVEAVDVPLSQRNSNNLKNYVEVYLHSPLDRQNMSILTVTPPGAEGVAEALLFEKYLFLRRNNLQVPSVSEGMAAPKAMTG